MYQSQTDPTSLVGSTRHIGNTIESLEQFGDGFRGNSDSSVPNAKLGHVAHAMYTDGNFSLEGEFEGVGNQIQNNLLPHIAIHVDRFPKIGAIHYEPQSGLVRRRTEYARQLRSEAR
jgi:hypothetical protein